MTEHIDNNEITNDLRYRFEYLSTFLNFAQDDITMLNKFSIIILPRIPIIVDAVYKKILSFDITKKYFLMRNDGFEGHLTKKSTNLTINSPQMTFRKDMLSVYLKRVLTQYEWNDTFLQYLSQVGKIHTDQAGSSLIQVDYIHINALFSYLEHLLLDILWTNEDLDDKNKYLMFMAINKFFWIQNDFFTMHYLKSWNENIPSNTSLIKEDNYCCF